MLGNRVIILLPPIEGSFAKKTSGVIGADGGRIEVESGVRKLDPQLDTRESNVARPKIANTSIGDGLSYAHDTALVFALEALPLATGWCARSKVARRAASVSIPVRTMVASECQIIYLG